MNNLLKIIDSLGEALQFQREVFVTFLRSPPEVEDIFEQVYSITLQSLSTTLISGFFVGGIMTVQFYAQLKQFDALSVLGGLSTSATIRELGPLLIAFMLSGKVGAFTAAELSTMRVSEQIDAMRCLGANPIQYIIVPRFLGILIASYFLLLLGISMSILGGAFLGILVADMNFQQYMSAVPAYVSWPSIINGFIKGFLFAFLLASVCTFRGFTAQGGSRGVGRAVVVTALSTMVGITLLDWASSFVLNIFWESL